MRAGDSARPQQIGDRSGQIRKRGGRADAPLHVASHEDRGTPFAGLTPVLLLFGAALFVSSSLLFLVQPMIAKMVLPLLGGTPAVWNTCMVFFQATLLAGYLYAHAATKWLKPRHQTVLHIVVLLVSLLTLPIVVSAGLRPPTSGTPIPWLLRVLVVSVGVPFFVISTSSPLLQRWFVRTGHPSARDPYFLYAAGNLGSLAALVGYPSIVEPTLRLPEQSWIWAAGYGLFVVLVAGCSYGMHAAAGNDVARDVHTPDAPAEAGPMPTAADRLRWTMLAAAPSSLLLGVTTHVTTDIAAVPLLWVVPLAIYLSTFVLVFARRTIVPHALMLRAMPLIVLPLATLIVFDTKLPPKIQMPVHVVSFFVIAMVCHGELARTRPTPSHLTEFYLWMSLGGVIGGLFNALIAPLVFRSVLEYPLAVVVACLLRPREQKTSDTGAQPWLDVALPAALGATVLGVLWVFKGGDTKTPLTILAVFVVPALVCFSFKQRPLRFALSLAALMLAGATFVSANQGVTYRGRSFFGVHRVIVNPALKLRYLIHGGTVHGAQSLDPARQREPLTYYHRSGPIAQVFAARGDRPPIARVGVVGLGTGALAAYGERGQQWTYYEIDPAIVKLANDDAFFTYLRDSAASIDVVLGDARISLATTPPQGYDVLVVDAFSSDAIPVHLVTREALQLYVTHLSGRGVVAFHLSNRYLDLGPLVSDLARDANLVVRERNDLQVTAVEAAEGKSPSRWAVMARRIEDLGTLAGDSRWRPIAPRGTARVWTDDFSNLLSLLRWSGTAADLR